MAGAVDGPERVGGSGGARLPTDDDLVRLGSSPGLCATCRHARVLASRSSVFLRCAMAETDPSFPRYPRLPVVACRGYEEVTTRAEPRPDPSPTDP